MFMELLNKANDGKLNPKIYKKFITNIDSGYSKGSKKNYWFDIYSYIFLKSEKQICDLINLYIKRKAQHVVDEIHKTSKREKKIEEEVYVNVSDYTLYSTERVVSKSQGNT
jgi:hypothetical protein